MSARATLAGQCRKLSFPTYGLAMRRLVEIAFEPESRWPRGKPLDAYRCRECAMWHLTRRPA